MRSFSVPQLLNDLSSNEKDSVHLNQEFIKNFNEFCDKDEKSKYIIEYTKPIVLKDRLDGLFQLSWAMFTNEYGMVPCEFHFDKELKFEFFDFLKQNGKLLHKRSCNTHVMENSYIFLYDGMYITFSIFFTDRYKDGYISACTFFHRIDKHIPYNIFSEFVVEKDGKTPKIGIIKVGKYGPSVTWLDHKTKYKFDINHYNSDFPEYYNNLKETINSNENGLYLMYGEAGTGKSSAIRHLITDINKKVVFIPPQMINCLSNPDFTDLVTNELRNCVLVIEDAEKALMKRESMDGFSNSELVSSVLNLTDGLYADICKTSIIATYNCNRNLIDPALLRKGRLLWEYHFKKLELEKSKDLMKKLGHEDEVKEEMILADIFNYKKQMGNDISKKPKKKAIGFAKE